MAAMHPNIQRTWVELLYLNGAYSRVLVVETDIETADPDNQSELDDVMDAATALLVQFNATAVRITPARRG